MKKSIFFALSMLLLVSCNSRKVYQKYEDMPGNTWPRDKTVTFEVPIEDVNATYDIDLAVRHTSYYPWANLKVNILMTYPNSEQRAGDFDFFIRNTDASFKGEGAGDIWDINFEYMHDFTFPAKGTYIIKVKNSMPLVETQDIMQIGLIIKKTK